MLFENEHDCVSSLFYHVKQPIILKSSITNRNIEQCIRNHQLLYIKKEDDEFVLSKHKSMIPRIIDLYINHFYVNQSQDKIQKQVEYFEDYFNSNLSLNELYKVFLYHIGKYTKIFDELSYEEMKDLSFDVLIEQFKKILPMFTHVNALITKQLISLYEIDKKALLYELFHNVQSANEKFFKSIIQKNHFISSATYSMKQCSLDDVDAILDLQKRYNTNQISREDITYFLSQPGSYYLFLQGEELVGYSYFTYIENQSAQFYFWCDSKIEIIKLANHILHILKEAKQEQILQVFLKLYEKQNDWIQFYKSIGFEVLPFYDKYALLDEEQLLTLVKIL